MKTFNRELSWLNFNARVLQEALDARVPLIERFRFLGIYSNNLDEFFRVRVAEVRRLIALKKKRIYGYDGSPEDLYKELRKVVLHQQDLFESCYKNLIELLKEEKIFTLNEDRLDGHLSEMATHYFNEQFKHMLFPIILDRKAAFPELRDDAIYLAVKIQQKGNANRYALVQIPSGKNRFLVLNEGENAYFILADDLIRKHLGDIFSIVPYDKISAYTFKFTRDAELDIEDSLGESYSEKIERSLKKRKKGVPVRFVYDETMPEDLLKYLLDCLKLGKSANAIPGGRYHNFKDFLQFPDFNRKQLVYQPQPANPHPDLENNKQILNSLVKKDVFLHFPYQKFEYIIDVLREAAIDPLVTEIKINVYRLAPDSQVMRALIAAILNRKQVVVVMELQARFDEENNLKWSNQLEEYGAKVIFGVPNLKVHSKLLYIKRQSKEGDFSVAYVGTGNFNERSSKIYTDFALLTGNKRVVSEVAQVFKLLENNLERVSFRNLLVSPINYRKKLLALMDKEIAFVKTGKAGSIKIKLNNLTDPEMIQKIVVASEAGVKVDMIVRGICCLKTNHKKNPNLTVISIVDRYLEHARCFVFGNGGNPVYYIGSADLMERNLDARIEVATPIFDRKIQEEIDVILDYQWRGTVKSRWIDSDMKNEYRQPEGPPFHAQQNLYLRYRSHQE
ncbi:MAG: polyphosphate kinase 1 [Bacteroidota bacterium]|jgi:polyphosphate kinase